MRHAQIKAIREATGKSIDRPAILSLQPVSDFVDLSLRVLVKKPKQPGHIEEANMLEEADFDISQYISKTITNYIKPRCGLFSESLLLS